MKTLCTLLAAALLAGCASTENIRQARGRGLKAVYPVPRAAAWQAALHGARAGELILHDVDTHEGCIVARTKARFDSWGERVAIWVTALASNRTEVEVASAQVVPDPIFQFNWEVDVLNAIRAELLANYSGTEAFPPLAQRPPAAPARSPKHASR